MQKKKKKENISFNLVGNVSLITPLVGAWTFLLFENEFFEFYRRRRGRRRCRRSYSYFDLGTRYRYISIL